MAEFTSIPYEIHGLTKVDYLTGFVSLLYAFSVSEFFIGWSKMLRNRQSIIFSTDHILFSMSRMKICIFFFSPVKIFTGQKFFE